MDLEAQILGPGGAASVSADLPFVKTMVDGPRARLYPGTHPCNAGRPTGKLALPGGELDMGGMDDWLRGIGLECYAHSFAQNDIDFRSLDLLTERDLETLGVSMGHRKLLARALEMRRVAEANGTNGGAADAQRGSFLAGSSDTGERRQVTAIFCDVVNSTGLATLIDPETWREILRRYENICTKAIVDFDGYVFQRLGDGVVAYFGYPTAHEDAPVRAIRAGLRILDSLSELVLADSTTLQVRIGISTGLVVVDDIRSKERSAVGHTMNLAARLQSVAEAGQIAISDTTYRLAGGNFEYVSLGELSLKGISRPERTWRVVGLGRAEGRFDAATRNSLSPLIGRDDELRILLDRWGRVCSGNGQTVVLSGEPGVGKSRILHALRERLDIDHANVIYCQCAQFFSNSAFYPIIECLDRGLRDRRDASASHKRERLESMLRDEYGLPPRDVTLIGAMFAQSAPEDANLNDMTPQRQREETIRALVDLIQAASLRHPVLMVFEDLHWADPTTLQTLQLLIARLAKFPALLIVTHRPEFMPTWSPDTHVATLAITKLSLADSARLAVSLGGESLPAELLEQMIVKTDGVPLYVEELTRAILENQMLLEAGKQADPSNANQALSIPATLRDSLMERLDRLGDDKEVAQIGSVLGREFSFEMLQAVMAWPQAPLDEALQRLVLSGLVVRRGSGAEAAYAFKHALVQDAAYDSLLRSMRQQLHQRIAETLEERFAETSRMRPELLAHHYGEATLHQQAVRYWYQAGKLAVARSANVEAINHLEAGLQRLKSLPQGSAYDEHELQFQTLLGNALMAVKGYGSPNVGSTFDRALELCDRLGDTPQLFPVLRGLWMFYLRPQRTRDGAQAERTTAAAGRAGPGLGGVARSASRDGHDVLLSGRVHEGASSLRARARGPRSDQAP